MNHHSTINIKEKYAVVRQEMIQLFLADSMKIEKWLGLIRRVIPKYQRCCLTGWASCLYLCCTHSIVTRDWIFHLAPAHKFITHRLARIHTYTGNGTAGKTTGRDNVCAGTEPALSVGPFLLHHVARNHRQSLGQRARGCLTIATEKSGRGRTLYWGPESGSGSREVLLLSDKRNHDLHGT